MTAARQSIFILIIGICATLAWISFANAGSMYSAAKRLNGLNEHKHTGRLAKSIGVNPRRVPWCGALAGYAARKAGYALPPGHLRAYNWTKFGYRVHTPRKGDIIVLRNRRGHHVTIYAGSAGKGKFKGLGGNQRNQVRTSTYRTASIVSIRRGGKKSFDRRAINTRQASRATTRAKRSVRTTRSISFRKTGLGKFIRKLRKAS